MKVKRKLKSYHVYYDIETKQYQIEPKYEDVIEESLFRRCIKNKDVIASFILLCVNVFGFIFTDNYMWGMFYFILILNLLVWLIYTIIKIKSE